MTEACSSLTFMTLYNPTKETSDCSLTIEETKSNLNDPQGVCVGKTAPHVELKIKFEDSVNSGRILIRGPHMMLGYWGQISTKESNACNGGWFYTGDIGKLDNHGNVWLIGRYNDRIKTGGENVYPEEVEAILSKHPGVSRVVVVGLPDTRFTEIVVACIQMKNTWKWADYGLDCSSKDSHHCLSSDILQNFCKDKNLTGFKVPKAFVIWTKPLPLTSSGKLRRDLIRSEVISHIHKSSSRL